MVTGTDRLTTKNNCSSQLDLYSHVLPVPVECTGYLSSQVYK